MDIRFQNTVCTAEIKFHRSENEIKLRKDTYCKAEEKHMGETSSFLVVFCVIFFALFSASSSAWGFENAIDFEDCHLSGFDEKVQCGYVERLENPDDPSSKRINIHVAKIAAKYPCGRSPLFLFSGGPGQAAGDIPGMMASAFRHVRKHHDLILIDQRGTGKSNPLECPFDASMRDIKAMGRQCLETLTANFDYYRTEFVIADTDAIRQALGYEKIHVWGGSFGTRVALMYMKHYGDFVERAVLDAVAPPQLSVVLSAHHAQTALENLNRYCLQDASCQKAFPNFVPQLEALTERLTVSPAVVELPEPRTGKLQEYRIDAARFIDTLRALLYSPSTHVNIPLLVDQASQGNFQAIIAYEATMASSIGNSMFMGHTFSTLCAEDATFLTPDAMKTNAEGSLFANYYAQGWADLCSVWPVGKANPDYFEPVTSTVPTLLLSGDLDPITQPASAEAAATHLTAATHIVAQGLGHIISGSRCAPKLMADFYSGINTLDSACLSDPVVPQFVTSPLGLTP